MTHARKLTTEYLTRTSWIMRDGGTYEELVTFSKDYTFKSIKLPLKASNVDNVMSEAVTNFLGDRVTNGIWSISDDGEKFFMRITGPQVKLPVFDLAINAFLAFMTGLAGSDPDPVDIVSEDKFTIPSEQRVFTRHHPS